MGRLFQGLGGLVQGLGEVCAQRVDQTVFFSSWWKKGKGVHLMLVFQKGSISNHPHPSLLSSPIT